MTYKKFVIFPRMYILAYSKLSRECATVKNNNGGFLKMYKKVR